MKLNFESDVKDIQLAGAPEMSKKTTLQALCQQHLANKLHYSLRTQGAVVTTIGFLKDAPKINIPGFFIYHKNRLIMVHDTCLFTFSKHSRFWMLSVGMRCSRYFGGYFHNKQNFGRTTIFQILETRLKGMTLEYRFAIDLRKAHASGHSTACKFVAMVLPESFFYKEDLSLVLLFECELHLLFSVSLRDGVMDLIRASLSEDEVLDGDVYVLKLYGCKSCNRNIVQGCASKRCSRGLATTAKNLQQKL
ncbi:hypothetical protein C5167_029212 [Papaver somniferum]|nr:hypothetical protein C5167_029212 [Papaver somniferum]